MTIDAEEIERAIRTLLAQSETWGATNPPELTPWTKRCMNLAKEIPAYADDLTLLRARWVAGMAAYAEANKGPLTGERAAE